MSELELQACCPAVLAAPLDEGEAVVLARAFAALADPARLRLLSLVAAAPEVCACELVEPLGRSQPTVSHHLKILFEAGLVTRQKRGTWVWYAAVPERLAALQEALATPPPAAAVRLGRPAAPHPERADPAGPRARRPTTRATGAATPA